MSDVGTYDIFLDYSSNKMGFILGKDEQGNKRWWPGLAPVLAQQINTGAFSYEQIPSEIDVPKVNCDIVIHNDKGENKDQLKARLIDGALCLGLLG